MYVPSSTGDVDNGSSSVSFERLGEVGTVDGGVLAPPVEEPDEEDEENEAEADMLDGRAGWGRKLKQAGRGWGKGC